ncbi:hypothetical protein FHL15_000776 [Xylaria flabelliformis]|uniref:Adp-ribosylation factor protein n=1 Tax=Xylaria flabelliformis TaxID=2512241 RepID=A0A553ID60_9PEZI|nr:hypothetical protein FHL15_000776 [Xylaria flabelliformis]
MAKFEDFDLEEVFKKATPHANNLASHNFVVEFGPERARIAFDLDGVDIEELLKGPRDTNHYPIRWIIQGTAVKAIGNHYEFSERLVRLMCMPTRQQAANSARRARDKHGLTKRFHRHGDVELGNLGHGANINHPMESHSTVQLQKGDSELMEDVDDDNTVLSIHEQPSFEPVPDKEDPDKWEKEELKNMRANTLDVLLQLSRNGFDLYKRKPLSLNSVRRPLSKWHARDRPGMNRHETGMSSFATGGEPVSLADEGTSNLFYYLFEDYVAAGPLKTAEKKLEQMRPQIRRKSIDIIPTLHYLSKDLRELKHLFENYKNLIHKITTLSRSDAQAPNGPVEDARRVMLTDTALSRFDRLGDRLQYLMLNAIEGYLGEISAVSSTYFNLTQQKDSEATARLTRSATLLAKLSVFFLPISFLTSYFSIQIEDLYMYWHGTDYWYSFAVIASVSFLCLFFFSRLLMFASDTLDEWASQIMQWFRRLSRAMGFKIPEEDE